MLRHVLKSRHEHRVDEFMHRVKVEQMNQSIGSGNVIDPEAIEEIHEFTHEERDTAAERLKTELNQTPFMWLTVFQLLEAAERAVLLWMMDALRSRQNQWKAQARALGSVICAFRTQLVNKVANQSSSELPKASAVIYWLASLRTQLALTVWYSKQQGPGRRGRERVKRMAQLFTADMCVAVAQIATAIHGWGENGELELPTWLEGILAKEEISKATGYSLEAEEVIGQDTIQFSQPVIEDWEAELKRATAIDGTTRYPVGLLHSAVGINPGEEAAQRVWSISFCLPMEDGTIQSRQPLIDHQRTRFNEGRVTEMPNPVQTWSQWTKVMSGTTDSKLLEATTRSKNPLIPEMEDEMLKQKSTTEKRKRDQSEDSGDSSGSEDDTDGSSSDDHSESGNDADESSDDMVDADIEEPEVSECGYLKGQL